MPPKIPKGLIVSCQALAGNPLRDSDLLAAMARAAELGGATAIRANGVEDIRAIRSAVSVPIVGINKQRDASGFVVITPNFDSAREIARAGADIIALDATFQESELRADLGETIARIHEALRLPVLADVSCLQEAERACACGADAISTTLSGYLPGHRHAPEALYTPDFALIEQILASRRIRCPLVAEGRFWRVEDMRRAFEMGVHALVVGKAITNPMAITAYFVSGLKPFT